MFLHLLCDPSLRQASLQSLKMIPKDSSTAHDPDGLEGSDFDSDDGPLNFDPSLGEVDVLGGFGLDDEPAEPEHGDFWIDRHDLWD